MMALVSVVIPVDLDQIVVVMIDVDKTLYKSTIDAINKLRY